MNDMFLQFELLRILYMYVCILMNDMFFISLHLIPILYMYVYILIQYKGICYA